MSLAELAAEIDKIQARDEELQHQLDGLLSARGDIEKKLVNLDAFATYDKQRSLVASSPLAMITLDDHLLK